MANHSDHEIKVMGRVPDQKHSSRRSLGSAMCLPRCEEPTAHCDREDVFGSRMEAGEEVRREVVRDECKRLGEISP